jgi:type II secretory pathway pseudopilin PulG
MTDSRSLRRARSPRGYLLIETLLSGAIIAVILAATMSVVASERADTTRATLRAKAGALAEDGLQQLLADSGTNASRRFTCDAGWQTAGMPAINTGDHPGFSREWDCDTIATSAQPTLGDLVRISVRVTFPLVGAATNGTKTTIEHTTLRRDRTLSR